MHFYGLKCFCAFVFSGECWFSGAHIVGKHMYALDYFGNAVRVFEVKTRKLIENITTDANPVGMYDLRWRKETWIHSWTLSTLDVIDTDERKRTHTAIKAHISPGKSKFWF